MDLAFPVRTTLANGDLDSLSVAVGPGKDHSVTAASIFKEHGFVILKGALSKDQAADVHRVCDSLHQAVKLQDTKGEGNRNPGRYSFGATVGLGQCLHLDAWTRHLVDNGAVLDVLDCIFGQTPDSETTRYMVSGAGGDYCLGRTPHFQKIHSDKTAARPLAPSKGDPSKGPIHQKELPPLVAVNYVVQDLTRWNGPMRIVTWKQMEAFGSERSAPQLDEELKEVPDWLASKIFPLQAGDALIRDVRVWHGGCPNMSGEPRFLPSMEVMSTEFFEWQNKGKKSGKKGVINRHGKQLLPEVLFNQISERAQRHCSDIVSTNAADEVNKHVDDTSWLRPNVVQAPRDPYHLSAVECLKEESSCEAVKMLSTLERHAKGLQLVGKERLGFIEYVLQFACLPGRISSASKKLADMLARHPSPEEQRRFQELFDLLWQHTCVGSDSSPAAASSRHGKTTTTTRREARAPPGARPEMTKKWSSSKFQNSRRERFKPWSWNEPAREVAPEPPPKKMRTAPSSVAMSAKLPAQQASKQLVIGKRNPAPNQQDAVGIPRRQDVTGASKPQSVIGSRNRAMTFDEITSEPAIGRVPSKGVHIHTANSANECGSKQQPPSLIERLLYSTPDSQSADTGKTPLPQSQPADGQLEIPRPPSRPPPAHLMPTYDTDAEEAVNVGSMEVMDVNAEPHRQPCHGRPCQGRLGGGCYYSGVIFLEGASCCPRCEASNSKAFKESAHAASNLLDAADGAQEATACEADAEVEVQTAEESPDWRSFQHPSYTLAPRKKTCM